MSEILRTLERNKRAAVKIGEVCGIPLGLYPHDYATDIGREDMQIRRELKNVFPRETILSYEQMVALVPDLLNTPHLIQKLAGSVDRDTPPMRISTTFLQHGAYAAHLLHTFEWQEQQASFVSYISRGKTDSFFGRQALYDTVFLPTYGHHFARCRPAARRHTDVIVPVTHTTVTKYGIDVPVYFTVLDQTRGEISVLPVEYTDRANGRGRVVLPVLMYSIPYTAAMYEANLHQQALIKSLQQKQTQEGAIHMILGQLMRLAESHAVLAQLSAYSPAATNIDAGDWMGIITPKLELTALKLMTVKAGVVETRDEDAWIQHVRTYQYRFQGVKLPLFETLTDTMLGTSWTNAARLMR